MLRNILQACNTSKSNYFDLDPNTAVVQEINNNFFSDLQDLQMWSFYETNDEPVVLKRRATLGK